MNDELVRRRRVVNAHAHCVPRAGLVALVHVRMSDGGGRARHSLAHVDALHYLQGNRVELANDIGLGERVQMLVA